MLEVVVVSLLVGLRSHCAMMVGVKVAVVSLRARFGLAILA